MKQKNLTKEQKEVLTRLNSILAEASAKNIGFVFDEGDCTLMAYNAENVNIYYSGCCQESDNDERINWDYAEYVSEFKSDCFNSGFDNYYFNFDEV